MYLLRWCSWVFGLDFFGYFFFFFDHYIQSSVDIPVTVTHDARGYLTWTLLGIIYFFDHLFKVQLSSLYSKFSSVQFFGLDFMGIFFFRSLRSNFSSFGLCCVFLF